MTVTLTKEEKKALLELLSLDMDSIGFEEEQIEVLDNIYDKVKAAK